MPEPGVNDRNFSRPTTKSLRGPVGNRPGGRKLRNPLRIPGEYAEFRLEDGRHIGEVLGPDFFGPPDRRLSDDERRKMREGNFVLSTVFRGEPEPLPLAGEGVPSGNPRFARGPAAADSEEADPKLPYGPEDEETDLEPAGEFEGFARKKQQALNGMFIIAKVDEIKKAEAARRGERTDLLETPRQQEQDEAAPPTGEPGFADMTEEE